MSIEELSKVKREQNFKESKIDAAIYFMNVFQKFIDWIETNAALDMKQNGFDSQIGKIYSGLEIVTQFKMQGIGPGSQYDIFLKNLKDLKGEDQEDLT